MLSEQSTPSIVMCVCVSVCWVWVASAQDIGEDWADAEDGPEGDDGGGGGGGDTTEEEGEPAVQPPPPQTAATKSRAEAAAGDEEGSGGGGLSDLLVDLHKHLRDDPAAVLSDRPVRKPPPRLFAPPFNFWLMNRTEMSLAKDRLRTETDRAQPQQQNTPATFRCCRLLSQGLQWQDIDVDAWNAVRKRVFLRCHLYIKMIILPRQARDKHSQNSKKSTVFFCCTSRTSTSPESRGERLAPG